MSYERKHTIARYFLVIGMFLSVLNFGRESVTRCCGSFGIVVIDFEDFDTEEKSENEDRSEKSEDEGEKEKITSVYAGINFGDLAQKPTLFYGTVPAALIVHLDPNTPPPEGV